MFYLINKLTHHYNIDKKLLKNIVEYAQKQ
jgi:hypothetical protein